MVPVHQETRPEVPPVITPKTIAITAGGLVLVAGAGTVAASTLGDDPESSVRAVEVGSLSESAPGASTSTTGGGSQQVAGLSELSGRVTQASDDDGFDDLVVDGIELDFGPDEWIARAGPMRDFDDDGEDEPLRAEIEGLRDTDATFRVRLDDDGDEADVYLINDLTYHDPAGAPPWQPSGSGADAATARDDDRDDDRDDPADDADDAADDADDRSGRDDDAVEDRSGRDDDRNEHDADDANDD
jgi:hypothetical protein